MKRNFGGDEHFIRGVRKILGGVNLPSKSVHASFSRRVKNAACLCTTVAENASDRIHSGSFKLVRKFLKNKVA